MVKRVASTWVLACILAAGLSAQNLVPNANFPNAATGITGWNSQGLRTALKWSPEDAYGKQSGSARCEVESAGDNHICQLTSTCIEVEPSTEYRFAAALDYRAAAFSASADGVRGWIVPYGGTDCTSQQAGGYQLYPEPDAGWVHPSATFTTGPSTHSVVIRFSVGGSASAAVGEKLMGIDEVYFGRSTTACGSGPVTFESGLPGDWESLDSSKGGGVLWTTTDQSACSIEGTSENRTGGSGEAACVDSDAAGSGSPAYFATLRSNSFDLTGKPALDLRLYYRDLSPGSNDVFWINLWVPSMVDWVTLAAWNATVDPGMPISIDLSPYTGENGAYLDFNYFGDGWDWYAQVDDVAVSCADTLFFDGFESGATSRWDSTAGD